MRRWTHFYGAFEVSKPHTWPNGVQIMRMAMTLFWPLDGWKCHNARSFDVFVDFCVCVCVCERSLYHLMHTAESFEISVNEVTFSWKIAKPNNKSHHKHSAVRCVRMSVWHCCFPQLFILIGSLFGAILCYNPGTYAYFKLFCTVV